MDWYLLAIISVFAASFTGIFTKILIKNDKRQVLESVILFQFLAAFIILIPAFLNGFKMPPVALFPINFILIGVLYGSAMILLFSAYRKVGASDVAILATLETLTVLILGNLFLNETLSINMIFGVLMILTSIIILSWNNFKKVNFNRGFMFVIIASILAGSAGVVEVIPTRNSDVLSFLVLGYLLPGIFVYLVYLVKNKRVFINLKNVNLKYISLLAIFSIIANIPFYFAIKFNGQISQILAINKTSIIFTILLAAIILNERSNLKTKVFSGLLSIIGIILLS